MYAQLKCNTYFFTPLSIMNSSKLSEPTLFKISSLLNSIFTFLFGRFGTFHRSCSSLHSLFKAQKRLKNKGKS